MSQRIKFMLFLMCLTLFFTGNVSAAPVYPPDTVYNGPKSVPSLPRPGYRQTVTDPTFGTRITRISGDEMSPSQNLYMQHEYSKVQPWNRDMTLIKLHSARFILNATDYSVFRTTSGLSESKWSTVDPDIIFYCKGTQFRKYNVRTGVDTTLHTFSGNIQMGPWEGNISIGDQYVVFNMGGQTTAVVYDILHDTIIATGNIGAAASDWMSISADGNYVILASNTGGGVEIRDRNLTLLRKIFAISSHGDMGYDVAGNPVLAQVCSTRMGRLDNGSITNLLPSYFFCGHLSTRGYLRPGWAVVSTENGNAELFAVKLDSSNIVERFAHTRSSESSYDAQSKGVISPDGSKVMWNSDWGSGTVYAYVAEMPGSSGTTDTTPPSAPKGLQILP